MVTEGADLRSVSNEQIRVTTGKDWREWCALLDKWGADKKLVPTVDYLVERHGLTRTHAQMVAVYYKWEKWSI